MREDFYSLQMAFKLLNESHSLSQQLYNVPKTKNEAPTQKLRKTMKSSNLLFLCPVGFLSPPILWQFLTN